MTSSEQSKKTSVGVFIQNSKGQWLLGHATGQRHWDIFKGLADPDEMPVQTALRELKEETGLVLVPSNLQDTGIHSYRSDKQLHIFTTTMEVDPFSLQCTSFFEHPKTLQQIAEMDAFAWYTRDEAKSKTVPRLWTILDTLSKPSPSWGPSL